MHYIAFGLILDHISFPDGRVVTNVLGGGGPQTAFGMKLWSDSVGLAASVGADLPEAAWAWLRASGVDTSGVRLSSFPTLRAVQRLEADGRRTHVWAVPPLAVEAHLTRSLAHLPETYRRARGFHLGLHPTSPNLSFLAGLRALGGLVSVETFRPAEHALAPDALRALLTAADIFSPGLNSARSLVGAGEPNALARRLIESGASVLALRMGAEGSLVMSSETGRAAHIPAVPVHVVDPIGAGNAYCGGFLTGWAETHDVVEAGLRGAVAASFLLERVGVPVASAEVRAEAQRRMRALRARVE